MVHTEAQKGLIFQVTCQIFMSGLEIPISNTLRNVDDTISDIQNNIDEFHKDLKTNKNLHPTYQGDRGEPFLY